jgi:hypothetical protein
MAKRSPEQIQQSLLEQYKVWRRGSDTSQPPLEGPPSSGLGGGGDIYGLGGRGGAPMQIDIGMGGTGRGGTAAGKPRVSPKQARELGIIKQEPQVWSKSLPSGERIPVATPRAAKGKEKISPQPQTPQEKMIAQAQADAAAGKPTLAVTDPRMSRILDKMFPEKGSMQRPRAQPGPRVDIRPDAGQKGPKVTPGKEPPVSTGPSGETKWAKRRAAAGSVGLHAIAAGLLAGALSKDKEAGGTTAAADAAPADQGVTWVDTTDFVPGTIIQEPVPSPTDTAPVQDPDIALEPREPSQIPAQTTPEKPPAPELRVIPKGKNEQPPTTVPTPVEKPGTGTDVLPGTDGDKSVEKPGVSSTDGTGEKTSGSNYKYKPGYLGREPLIFKEQALAEKYFEYKHTHQNFVQEDKQPAYTRDQYIGWAKKYSEQYNIPLSMVLHAMFKETGWLGNAEKMRTATSPTGARGVMQIQPEYAEKGAYKIKVKDLTDPEKNIEAGVRGLAYYFNKYKDPQKALAAYNAGESGAKTFLRTGDVNTLRTRETRNYIKDFKDDVIHQLEKFYPKDKQKVAQVATDVLASAVGAGNAQAAKEIPRTGQGGPDKKDRRPPTEAELAQQKKERQRIADINRRLARGGKIQDPVQGIEDIITKKLPQAQKDLERQTKDLEALKAEYENEKAKFGKKSDTSISVTTEPGSIANRLQKWWNSEKTQTPNKAEKTSQKSKASGSTYTTTDTQGKITTYTKNEKGQWVSSTGDILPMPEKPDSTKKSKAAKSAEKADTVIKQEPAEQKPIGTIVQPDYSKYNVGDLGPLEKIGPGQWRSTSTGKTVTDAPELENLPAVPRPETFLDKVKRTLPPSLGGGGELVSQVFGDKKKPAAAPDATDKQPAKDPAYEPGTAEYDARMEKLQIAAGDKFSREREARLKATAEKPADKKIELQRDQAGLVKAKRELSDFERAFAAARAEQGAGGTFTWTDPRTGKTDTYGTLYKGEKPPKTVSAAPADQSLSKGEELVDIPVAQAKDRVQPPAPAPTAPAKSEIQQVLKDFDRTQERKQERKQDIERVIQQLADVPAATPAPRTAEELASDELWKDIRASAAGKSSDEISAAAQRAKQELDTAIAADSTISKPQQEPTELPGIELKGSTEPYVAPIDVPIDSEVQARRQTAKDAAQDEMKESINTTSHADLHDILRLAGRLK